MEKGNITKEGDETGLLWGRSYKYIHIKTINGFNFQVKLVSILSGDIQGTSQLRIRYSRCYSCLGEVYWHAQGHRGEGWNLQTEESEIFSRMLFDSSGYICLITETHAH